MRPQFFKQSVKKLSGRINPDYCREATGANRKNCIMI